MNPRITEYGEARRILKLQDHAIHKMKNVNYTGVRFEDGQWKLHIGVTKRLPEHEKLLNPVINFSGLPLIFDEIGEIKALTADRKIKYRPAPPGVSVGHYLITAGTLGVTCFKDGAKYILSNNHVLANCNAGVIGDHILQQGTYDGGANPADEIGTLAAFVPIVFNDQINPNHIDCALALPLASSDLLDEILELGYPTGSKEAAVGMNVIKSGRTTGITEGTIQEFSGLVEVNYGTPGNAWYDDQIITGPMLLGGDSGSCLLDALDNKAVGLCFATSGVISIANRMTEVVAALGIAIFQPDYAIGTTQGAVTDSEAGTISLNGYVAYAPGTNPHRYFEWGEAPGTYSHTEDCGVGGVGAFSTTIPVGANPRYFRAKVVDGVNTNYGREMDCQQAWDGGIGEIYTIKTDCLTGSLNTSGCKIVRDSKDILHVVYHRLAVVNNIFHSYSSDGGQTWTEEAITTDTTYAQERASIAIDSNDVLHVVWQCATAGYPKICYSKCTISWSAPIDLSNDASNSQIGAAIAIDSTNRIYVVWSGGGAGNADWRIKYAICATSWTAQANIPGQRSGHWGYYYNVTPSIAIDLNDNVYVTWIGFWTSGTYTQVQCAVYTTSWIDAAVITNEESQDHTYGYDQLWPHIAFTRWGDALLVWSGKSSRNAVANQIQFSRCTTSWSPPINISNSEYDQLNPTIAADSLDKIHVVWFQNGGQIKYSEYASSWRDPIDETTGANYKLQPGIMGQNQIYTIPTAGYCFVYMDDTTLKFYINAVLYIKPFIPTIHSFPWVGKFRLIHTLPA